jgi:hypothetical protein
VILSNQSHFSFRRAEALFALAQCAPEKLQIRALPEIPLAFLEAEVMFGAVPSNGGAA